MRVIELFATEYTMGWKERIETVAPQIHGDTLPSKPGVEVESGVPNLVGLAPEAYMAVVTIVQSY